MTIFIGFSIKGCESVSFYPFYFSLLKTFDVLYRIKVQQIFMLIPMYESYVIKMAKLIYFAPELQMLPETGLADSLRG